MFILNPVQQLGMRVEFLQGILDVAQLCNWTDKELEDLQELLLQELIAIDNLMYDVYEETRDRDLASAVWDSALENLRRWLSLILGIRIKYI